ncbi:SNAP25 likeous protein SNAP33 [Apostasia shenzhenica]|uniref:SNAP25 likeous protein SNAP33 n=1 Tax=Apostasia shenzhenica TaxID=1088818 RepID=A0A2I0BAX3_9ASPA|nr:SNAP25 likeous protein SNAP33 [Apostasia shenzhenica]
MDLGDPDNSSSNKLFLRNTDNLLANEQVHSSTHNESSHGNLFGSDGWELWRPSRRFEDQLGVHNFEANCVGNHVHSLEQKLAAVKTLHAKLRLLTEELVQSDTNFLLLTRELKSKNDDLQYCEIQIEELEAAISSAALESQCEIESMKLDMIALEEKCFQSECLSEQIGQEKAKMLALLEEYEAQFYEAQDKICFLEMENNELKIKLNESERHFKELHGELEERLSSWIKQSIGVSDNTARKDNMEFFPRLNDGYSSLHKACKIPDVLMLELRASACEEISCPLLSNLTALMASDKHVKGEMERMSNLILESEFLVQTLKEELREEKKKAKEEAEDLTQAMAELRYEITGMLEDECKHRASIEQASLSRIQALEEEGYQRMTGLEIAQKIDSCGSSSGCHIAETSFDCLTKSKEGLDVALKEDLPFSALLEWKIHDGDDDDEFFIPSFFSQSEERKLGRVELFASAAFFYGKGAPNNSWRAPKSNVYKQNPAVSTFNPFDSDSDREQNVQSTKTSSSPAMKKSHHRSPQSIYVGPEETGINRYKNNFGDSGGFENQSVQELESYAVKKAEETTQTINGCVKIAEEIREVSSRTLVNLHQQGEQITRTHETAASIDHNLSRGEKLLGSLGGLFSKTWKPKKARQIKGPSLTRGNCKML